MKPLSPAALDLFRLHVERHGDLVVDDSNRETYRELARAGFMQAVSTFAGGPESAYRVTKEGFDRKAELLVGVKAAG
jgi:hypothetical protein